MSSQCQPRNVRSDRIVGRDEPDTARAIANTYMSISGDLDARGFELLLLLRLVTAPVTRKQLRMRVPMMYLIRTPPLAHLEHLECSH